MAWALRMERKVLCMTSDNWIKIDEQQAESSWMGYEDFISADGKTIKRVWYDGCEEEWEA